ncbi:MAG: hypothetical protein MI784_16955 [Cytophagales bacterium]|nr:hypothetical protein [Cytophagales bacterium]
MKEEQRATAVNQSTGFIERMKTKWGVESAWQVIAILTVFTLTGLTVVQMRKFLFALLGYTEDTALWLKTVTYLLCVFPSYQALILVYGTLLGQFRFFWEKEKKLGRMIARLFKRK